jgi:dTDP-4-amino-4,6-dideoxygalactose transaminase
MSKLALFGGLRAVQIPLTPFVRIGDAERREVEKVLASGELSGFVGAMGNEYRGGRAVRSLEDSWAERFGCKYAVSVNSNTSGLFASVGAIGAEPGDEIIVPPYTMSATAMAPLVYGAVPVFVDIEPDYFCLDPALVENAITPRTKAIIVVNLFGHAAQLAELRSLADKHGIYLIEDNAQGPLAEENDRLAGTVGHIGVFSLNRHKHIQTGEGGICTTNDDDLATRLMAIRNHGENVVAPLGLEDVPNLIGFNYRMTELSAAVGIAQLDRADQIIEERIELAQKLTAGVAGIDAITPPMKRNSCKHVYYDWASRFDEIKAGVSRESFAKALEAEGVPNSTGYVEPLYRLPIFRNKMAIGKNGYPFNLNDQDYSDGICPVTERMYEKEVLEFFVCSYDPNESQMQQIIDAFHKVYENRAELSTIETKP